MRIALINENSQAGKNEIIYRELKGVVEPMGHVVDNYGMYSADDEAQLTYVQCGILASLLLSSGACRFCSDRLWYWSGSYDRLQQFSKCSVWTRIQSIRCISVCTGE